MWLAEYRMNIIYRSVSETSYQIEMGRLTKKIKGVSEIKTDIIYSIKQLEHISSLLHSRFNFSLIPKKYKEEYDSFLDGGNLSDGLRERINNFLAQYPKYGTKVYSFLYGRRKRKLDVHKFLDLDVYHQKLKYNVEIFNECMSIIHMDIDRYMELYTSKLDSKKRQKNLAKKNFEFIDL